jgi:hypothetical protein
MLNNVAEETVANREANDTRRRWLARGIVALVVAAVFLVLHVGVFLERAAEDTCPERPRVEVLHTRVRASVPDHLSITPTPLGIAFKPALEPDVAEGVADQPPVEVGFGCFGKRKTKT